MFVTVNNSLNFLSSVKRSVGLDRSFSDRLLSQQRNDLRSRDELLFVTARLGVEVELRTTTRFVPLRFHVRSTSSSRVQVELVDVPMENVIV